MAIAIADVLLEGDVVEAGDVVVGDPRRDRPRAARLPRVAHTSRITSRMSGIPFGGDQQAVARAGREQRAGDLGKRLAHHVLVVLADVGEHADVRADDHPLAHLLVLGLDRHALDHERIDIGRQVPAGDLDLLEDRGRSAAVDRLVDTVAVDDRRERAGRLGDRHVAGLAQHPGDDPRHGRLAADPVDVDAPFERFDPPPVRDELGPPAGEQRDAHGDPRHQHDWHAGISTVLQDLLRPAPGCRP